MGVVLLIVDSASQLMQWMSILINWNSTINNYKKKLDVHNS
jgi:hypothetical protein